MSEQDLERLFNDISVQTRDKRKHLKEVLDRVFEDDSGRTAEVLSEMMRINEKAQTIESSRPQFMSVMSAMRSVRAVREELLEKVDRLMDEIRRFLALKEELANERLDKLTSLFREELGNAQFKFHFQLMDDQELHHLSEVRSLARREPSAEPMPSIQAAPPAPPSRPMAAPPPPPPSVQAAPPPPPPPVQEPSWADTRAQAAEEPPAWSTQEESRPSWLSQTVAADNPMTIRGVAPEPQVVDEGEVTADAMLPQTEPEQEQQAGANPYEVDVDVLRILSEETFRPPKR